MEKQRNRPRKIADFDSLVVDLVVTDKRTKAELDSLKKTGFLFDINLAKQPEETYQLQLLEGEFERRLLELEFKPELSFEYKITKENPDKDLQDREVDISLKLQDLKSLHADNLDLREESKRTFERALRLELEIERLKQEREKSQADFTEKIRSIEADLSSKIQDGLRRREEEILTRFNSEKEELKLYGSQPLLSELLPHFLTLKSVIDSGRTLEDKTIQAYLKGFDMVVRSISDSLDLFGIKEIEPKVGDEFDPALHSGQSTASDNSLPEGVILEVKLSGFKLHDRLLIPAIVVVNKL